MDHHPLSPSKFPAWLECPCYDGMADDGDDKSDANMGRLQHEAQAKMLSGDSFGWRDGLTLQQQDNVEWCVKANVRIAQQHGHLPDAIRVEQKLSLLDDDFNEVYFGTGDVEIGRDVMTDSKFGLERDYFAQFCGYALAKMQKDSVDRIMFCAIYGQIRKIKPMVIARDVAQSVVETVLAKRNNPDRRPSPCQWCGLCANKLSCSAFLNRGAIALSGAPKSLSIDVLSGLPEPLRIGAMRFILDEYVKPWTDAIAESNVQPVVKVSRSHRPSFSSQFS